MKSKLKFIATFILISSFSILISSCKKTPASEKIQGKWIITSQNILGSEIAGDGSFLTFDACSSTCSGTDYEATNGTSGNFTYTLNPDENQLIISDTTNNGGNYNFTWTIEQLTKSDLRISTTTFFGNAEITLAKD